MRLRTLHALSATVVATYAAVHIANHLAALRGVAAHIAFMDVARSVYRNPVVETLLLGCVAFQVLSGLGLLVGGWRQRRGAVPWLQAIAGAYLAFFLLVHVSAVLFGRIGLGLDTNFYFAAAGFHIPPFPFFFAPYYFLGVLALFTHLGCAAWWRARRLGHPHARAFVAVPAAGGLLLSVLIVLLLAGVFYPVDIPPEYKTIYGKSAQPAARDHGHGCLNQVKRRDGPACTMVAESPLRAQPTQ